MKGKSWSSSSHDSNATVAPTFGEGDTTIIYDLLPVDTKDDIFEKLKTEVKWATMFHQGGQVPRLVAVQGYVDAEGNHPVYRHPSDESPPLMDFTPTVRTIKQAAEKHVSHPLNHVLIQWYRNGHDYISEHSDKTLDIAPGSVIANVSLGAQRTMILRTKAIRDCQGSQEKSPTTVAKGLQRTTVRVPLPHNSMFVMGLRTNMVWLHGLRQDKRSDLIKAEAETAFGGTRISLTFRLIKTYMNEDCTLIWGQGATGKSRADAQPVVNGQGPATIRMLKAFGAENQQAQFNWEEHYGPGFDVLHIRAVSRLFTGPDKMANNRVRMLLGELGISYSMESISTGYNQCSRTASIAGSISVEAGDSPIKFVDTYNSHYVVQGDTAIMKYLDEFHGDAALRHDKARTERQLTVQRERFQQSISMSNWWIKQGRYEFDDIKLKMALADFESYLKSHDSHGAPYLCGNELTIVDFLFLATLHDIMQDGRAIGSALLAETPMLAAYYKRLRERPSVVDVLGDISLDLENPDSLTVTASPVRA